MSTTPYTVLFDLDGTFLDTAPDMAAALNRLRVEENLNPLPYSALRDHVSNGSAAMIEVGFELTDHSDSTFKSLQKRFLKIYEDNIAEHTSLFPGMADVIDTLDQKDILWGVVTNKPGWLTEPLLKALALDARCACIISGDTLKERKPDPAPVLYGCKIAGGLPEHSVYIGDAVRDIEAGNSAGMKTLIAKYGYISEQEQQKLDTWHADDIIEHPTEILEWLHGQSILT